MQAPVDDPSDPRNEILRYEVGSRIRQEYHYCEQGSQNLLPMDKGHGGKSSHLSSCRQVQ